VPLSTLTDDEKTLVARLSAKIRKQSWHDTKLDRYYEGEQRLEHIGLAVPPELRRFETVINIPAMAVDETERRQDLREFQRSNRTPGAPTADPALMEAFEYNNLRSQSSLCHKDTKIFGRSCVSVHTNDEDEDFPLITIEDATQIACLIDNRRRRMVAALRLYRDDVENVQKGTLYLPNSTLWLARGRNGWVVEDRDDHNLGAVAMVLHLNRSRTARWAGTTEMRDVIGMTDSIARLLTNMSVAAETHSVPSKWVAGVTKGDFVDKDGKPLPAWEAYFSAIMATTSKDAKFGQFQASDLRNFHESVNNMLAWCAAVLGLPTRYAGQQSVNPATEGSIRADESRLIKNVERMNDFAGDSWAWTGSLYERFRTGEWPERNSIRVLWNDPATPTRAQTADATVKLFQAGILSREGSWDELGWSPERKSREKDYLQREGESDPELAAARQLTTGNIPQQLPDAAA
jgi:hypothetical protein